MSPKPRKPSPSGSLHSQAFAELCELQIDAIRAMKALVQSGAIEVSELATLIDTTAKAITTHRAVVTDDEPEASGASDDRRDTTSA